MDSNVCGPSNAAKGLAKHLDQDRSRQQDRLVQGGNVSESFRVGPSLHQAPHANQAFWGFQNGNAGLPAIGPYAPSSNWLNPGPLGATAPLGAGPTYKGPKGNTNMRGAQDQGRDWAADFQAISLNATGRPAFPQQMQPATQMQPAQRGLGGAPVTQTRNIPMTPLMAQSPHFIEQQRLWQAHMAEVASMERQSNMSQQTLMDEEFQKAMDQWMEANPIEEKPAAVPAVEARPESPVQEADKKDKAHDDTELARVAQQLVDSVASDESEKFRNSNFLSLMRKIAAKEVVIQDSSLVDTNGDADGATTSAPDAIHAYPDHAMDKASSSYKGKEKATTLI